MLIKGRPCIPQEQLHEVWAEVLLGGRASWVAPSGEFSATSNRHALPLFFVSEVLFNKFGNRGVKGQNRETRCVGSDHDIFPVVS